MSIFIYSLRLIWIYSGLLKLITNLKNSHVNVIVYYLYYIKRYIKRKNQKVVLFIISGVAKWLKYHSPYAPGGIGFKFDTDPPKK